MNSKFENLRIPTLLGLFVLILGISASLYLTLQNQTLKTQAAPEITPKNITVTNIEDDRVTISWQTQIQTIGFVTFGTGSAQGQTALDDRDSDTPTKRVTHHVTLLNLLPQTTYQFRVVSSKFNSEPQKFTPASTSDQNYFKPVIGSVLDNDKPLSQGLVYLQIDGAVTQSAVIKNSGNFIMPISKMRRSNLSSIFTPVASASAKLTVTSEDGRTGSATFILTNSGTPIGPLKVNHDLDLKGASLGVSTKRVDLNGDGVVNSLDYVMVLKNKIDLNADGVFDKKDLTFMQEFINQ